MILVFEGENCPRLIKLQLQDKLDWVLSNNATFCKEALEKKNSGASHEVKCFCF